MALSKFRSFDDYQVEVPMKDFPLKQRENVIKNDDELKKELEALNNARKISDKLMDVRITF